LFVLEKLYSYSYSLLIFQTWGGRSMYLIPYMCGTGAQQFFKLFFYLKR